ncbi:MAG: hypothetical protein ACTS5A_03460 [Candidatus Hodgkinia cicadicola]
MLCQLDHDPQLAPFSMFTSNFALSPSAANPRSSFASTILTLLPGRRVHVLHLFSKTCPSKFVNLYQVFD